MPPKKRPSRRRAASEPKEASARSPNKKARTDDRSQTAARTLLAQWNESIIINTTEIYHKDLSLAIAQGWARDDQNIQQFPLAMAQLLSYEASTQSHRWTSATVSAVQPFLPTLWKALSEKTTNDNDTDAPLLLSLATHILSLYWKHYYDAATIQTVLQCCGMDTPRLIQHHLSPHLAQWYHKTHPHLFDSNDNKNNSHSNTTHEIPFVVTLCDSILSNLQVAQKLLQKEQSQQQQNNNDSDQEEEDAMETTTTEHNHPTVSSSMIHWPLVHRGLEFLTTLLTGARNPARTYLLWYLQSTHLVLYCRKYISSSLTNNNNNHNTPFQLTAQLLDALQSAMDFPLEGDNTTALYYARAAQLQKLAHRYFAGRLDDVIFSGLGQVLDRSALATLTLPEWKRLLHKLRLVDAKNTITDENDTDNADSQEMDFMWEILKSHLQQPPHPLDALHGQPLLPADQLFQMHLIPPNHTASSVLVLPQLLGQFQSPLDYLVRNYGLLQRATAAAIRSDVAAVLSRVKPVVQYGNSAMDDQDEQDIQNQSTSTSFTGWSRNALELSKVTIVEVAKPLLGHAFPPRVLAEVTIDLQSLGASIRQEWASLQEYDVVLLLSVDASQATQAPAMTVGEWNKSTQQQQQPKHADRPLADEDDPTLPERTGLQHVRAGTIVHVRDAAGNIVTDPDAPPGEGTQRIVRLELDPVQYALDTRRRLKNTTNKPNEDGAFVYRNMNLMVRRSSRENGWRAMLETTRNLLVGSDAVHRVLPPWLMQVLLGHNVTQAHYLSATMQQYAAQTAGVPDPATAFLDFADTFVDEAHMRSSFGDHASVKVTNNDRDAPSSDPQARLNYKVRCSTSPDGKTMVEAQSYKRKEGVKGNSIQFTPKQVEAVRSGLSCGLTLVVGPPGTGKTGVAVQIIVSLYHSFPTQRTVIITHSNAALNDIFEKVMARGDVEERYLLRLGAGERNLQIESTHDFTKIGRVQYCFQRRAEILEQVQLLSESLGLSGRAERGADGSPSYTCETAAIFYAKTIQPKMRTYRKALSELDKEKQSDEARAQLFPFGVYFGITGTLSANKMHESIQKLDSLFGELAEYRPLEILRTQRQRSDYLLLSQAKVVAMTSTHAAIARPQLVELGFQYDNLVVEEAGQMTELDTFIPFVLQKGKADDLESRARLKRVCLLGDHNQLPPVIKNMTLARYTNLDQSMFQRLIKVGVPHIELDKQGRTRPEIADLYNWRYGNLGNLDHVSREEKFLLANAGFASTLQFINVENYNGKGETTPTAYFYQNVGEAEYIVALFQFMVMIGYPPHSISILTTYNGQKELIKDILSQRCGDDTPLAGVRPGAVSTVDEYQGQQNDVVLLSLVRSESIGHLRDVRRLVVAVSRARFGLYVFGRYSLFSKHSELEPVFSKFQNANHRLQLVIQETHPTERKASEAVNKEDSFEVEDVEHLGAMVHQMQQDMLEGAAEAE